MQAYNDWTLDEWCAAAPDRLIPCVLVPLWDPDWPRPRSGARAAKGGRTVTFPENPVPLGLPSFHTDHWDPFWAAVAGVRDARLDAFRHVGPGADAEPRRPDGRVDRADGHEQPAPFSDLLFSEVFHKFPGVKVSLAEGGIGWMPWLLERIDYTWERHRGYQNYNTSVRPSETGPGPHLRLLHRGPRGLALRHEIGIDQIMWEGDYPHSDSQFPASRKRAAEAFADIPDDDVRKIVETNARRLFRFPGRA